MRQQPTEAMELANAAYVWLEACQRDLLDVVRKETFRDGTHEEIVWHFERYQRAYDRHQAAEAARTTPDGMQESAR